MISILLVVVFLLASCDNGSAGQGKPLSSPLLGQYRVTPGPTAPSKGRLVFADLQFPVTANPLFASSNADLTIETALWGQPIFYDQQFHVHADQLTEVPLPENGGVLDGGRTILMHLRHDLRWSDGQPIVASDFQYWWRLNQDSNTGATTTSGYDQIASIEAPDIFTVVLHMKRPFGPYLFYLPYAAPQHAWGRLQPIELQNISWIFQSPTVTSGPYKIKKLEGHRYILESNKLYVSTTFHGPYLSELVYQAYNTLEELKGSVQAHQVDVAQGYQEYDLPGLAKLSGQTRVVQTSMAAYEHLDFNNAQPVFRDIHVRKAIQSAIDICALAEKALQMQNCSRRVNQVEPLPSLFYDSTIQPSKYDPALAKMLLAQAGWLPDEKGSLVKNGVPFTLRLVTTADNPLRAAVVSELQRYLFAIGIQVKVQYSALSTFFGGYAKGGVLATGAYDLALFSYANSPEPDDEYTVFHSSQIPDRDHPDGGNYGRVDDPIIDQALTEGRDTVAFNSRVALYHHFLQRLADQVYMIPLFVDSKVMTINEHVQNVIPNPNQSAATWNISDWWLIQ